ncbi:hypothetical protein R5R35_013086 [Gryllus longicercus]|uniref:Uncharacterized protein n=1 Tax=Gryllus longicercus TaxID=2509291 RepID=A0AAN9YVG8_9ORTH
MDFENTVGLGVFENIVLENVRMTEMNMLRLIEDISQAISNPSVRVNHAKCQSTSSKTGPRARRSFPVQLKVEFRQPRACCYCCYCCCRLLLRPEARARGERGPRGGCTEPCPTLQPPRHPRLGRTFYFNGGGCGDCSGRRSSSGQGTREWPSRSWDST